MFLQVCVCQRLIQILLLRLYGYDGWVSQSKKCGQSLLDSEVVVLWHNNTPVYSDNRREYSTFFCYRLSQRISWRKAIFTANRQDEDSSPLLGVTPLGRSHPCGQWAAGDKEWDVPGLSYCYPENRARREGRAGSGEAQQQLPPPPAASHVHRAHGNPRHVQVH